MIEFRMLGALDLRSADGRDLNPVLAQPKLLALLTYLAVATPRGFQRRDTLVAMLWPDLDQKHARAALRQALFSVRQSLGADAISTRGDEEIGLDADQVWSDVVGFERAREAGRWSDALDCYRGHMMEGFFVAGAADFERWLDGERARLRESAVECAMRLGEQLDATGDPAAALSTARRAVRLAPHDEGSVRRLIALLDRLGDRAGAVAAYDDFARRLASELEVEPAAETKALIAAVRVREGGGVVLERIPPTADGSVGVEGSPVTATRRRAPWLLAGAAAATVVLAAVGLRLAGRSAGARHANRVAVAAFTNRTGDSALGVIGAIAADWISRGLAETGLLEVADVQPGGGQLAEFAREARADTVVWGAYYRSGDSLRFEARISDVRHATVLRALEPVPGSVADPIAAIEVLRQRVTGSMATLFDPKLRTWAEKASQPPTFEAYRALVAGLAASDRLDPRAALRAFTEAAGRDSAFTLPLVMMAQSFTWQGDCVRTDSIRRFIDRTRRQLPSVDRFRLDKAVLECRGDVDGAYQNARALQEAWPGSDLATANLGRSAFLANRPREAVTALEEADPERGALRGNAPYYLWLTSALHHLGQHDRELRAAQRAVRRYPTNVATLRMELFALAALGRGAELPTRFAEITSRPAHPLRRPGVVLREIAAELDAHGASEAARATLDSALAWLRARPEAERQATTYQFDLAQVQAAMGHLAEAEHLALALVREHPDAVAFIGLQGVLAAQRRDAAAARRADSTLAATRLPYLRGYQDYWRAAIAARLGDRSRAVALLTDAFHQGLALAGVRPDIAVEFVTELHADPHFASLRGFRPFVELVRPKG